MVDRGRERRPLRWVAGAAVLAVGAATLFGRRRARPGPVPAAAAFETGRGHPLAPPSADSRRHGYETRDTDVRALVIIMAVAIGLIVIGVGAVFAMYAGFSRGDVAGDSRLTAEQRAPIVPPGPHLQDDPYAERDAALAAQRQALTTYGWIDAAHTRARIPIDRGIALVVGKPLDEAPPASIPVPPGAAPSESAMPEPSSPAAPAGGTP